MSFWVKSSKLTSKRAVQCTCSYSVDFVYIRSPSPSPTPVSHVLTGINRIQDTFGVRGRSQSAFWELRGWLVGALLRGLMSVLTCIALTTRRCTAGPQASAAAPVDIAGNVLEACSISCDHVEERAEGKKEKAHHEAP